MLKYMMSKMAYGSLLKKKQGFTLIEVIVSMALLSIVILIAASLLTTGQKMYKKGLSRSDIQYDVRMAADFISDELRNAKEVIIDDTTSEMSVYNTYYSIAVTSGALQFKPAGSNSFRNKTGNVFVDTGAIRFTYSPSSSPGSLHFDLYGNQDYDVSSDVYLQNGPSVSGTSGNRIFYKKPGTVDSAEYVALSITGIPAQPLDSATFIMPSVPAGYTIAIKPSTINPGGIINPDYTINRPLVRTQVSMVFVVTRTADGSIFETTGLSTFIDPASPTAQAVADGIVSVTAPEKRATQLIIPTAAGFRINIFSSSREDVIGLDGSIKPPNTNTTVGIVFLVTKQADSTTATSININVTVPDKN